MFFRSLIPNTLTSLNLLCGCVAVGAAFEKDMVLAAWLVALAMVFDFLDGLAARVLNAQSSIGKQLDSLADMVTFGVLPGVFLFQFISIGLGDAFTPIGERATGNLAMECLGFLLTIFAAIRLAKFNLATDQDDSFRGLPTPAMALFVVSFPIILEFQLGVNLYHPITGDAWWSLAQVRRFDTFDAFVIQTLWSPWFHIGVSVIGSFLMVSNVRLLSLKFKSLRWKKNRARYYLLLVVGLAIVSVFYPYWNLDPIGLGFLEIRHYPDIDFAIVPVIVVLYLLMSGLNNLLGWSPDPVQPESQTHA